MTFSHFNRRVHLYLGLALLPWFLMYGVSSMPFAHRRSSTARPGQATAAVDAPVRAPARHAGPGPEAFRHFGAALLKHAGIEGTSFGAYRQSPTQVNVYSYSFWTSTQLKYLIDRKTLVVEDHRFRWDHFLTGMHARGGFEQEDLLPMSWSVVVDVFASR